MKIAYSKSSTFECRFSLSNCTIFSYIFSRFVKWNVINICRDFSLDSFRSRGAEIWDILSFLFFIDPQKNSNSFSSYNFYQYFVIDLPDSYWKFCLNLILSQKHLIFLFVTWNKCLKYKINSHNYEITRISFSELNSQRCCLQSSTIWTRE